MQIHYKIPGWEPVRSVAPGARESIPSPFQAKLSAVSRRQPIHWRTLLQLDRPPAGVVTIGPPRRPASYLEVDPAIERQMTRSLIERHAYHALHGAGGKPVDPAVRDMVSLLLEHQTMEDDLMAIYLREARD